MVLVIDFKVWVNICRKVNPGGEASLFGEYVYFTFGLGAKLHVCLWSVSILVRPKKNQFRISFLYSTDWLDDVVWEEFFKILLFRSGQACCIWYGNVSKITKHYKRIQLKCFMHQHYIISMNISFYFKSLYSYGQISSLCNTSQTSKC